jgi:hypothetical protein
MALPWAGFGLAALRLTAEIIENLSALSGVAYEKFGAILPHLLAPTPAPTPAKDEFLTQLGTPSSCSRSMAARPC